MLIALSIPPEFSCCLFECARDACDGQFDRRGRREEFEEAVSKELCRLLAPNGGLIATLSVALQAQKNRPCVKHGRCVLEVASVMRGVAADNRPNLKSHFRKLELNCLIKEDCGHL